MLMLGRISYDFHTSCPRYIHLIGDELDFDQGLFRI
jgi:hypothetical protein